MVFDVVVGAFEEGEGMCMLVLARVGLCLVAICF